MGLRKKCKLCNLTKPLQAFNPNAEMADGRRNECKTCLNKKKLAHKKESFSALPESSKAAKRQEWRELYSERISYFQKRYKNKPKNKTVSSKFADYKRGAKYRGFEFDLQFDEFSILLSAQCAYCGGLGGGIDRVDSTRGYSLDNCAPCCKRCNQIKLHYPLSETMTHLKKMIDRWEGA